MEIEQKIGLKGADLGWQSRMVIVACLVAVMSYAAALLGDGDSLDTAPTE